MEITKKELEEMYRKNKTLDVAKKLNVSCPTLIRYLKENGIPLKKRGDGWNVRKRKLIVEEQ